MNAATLTGFPEMHVTKFVEMEEIMVHKGNGITEMQTNVMMEIRDQAMDAILLAELKEDGVVKVAALMSKMCAHLNAVTGASLIKNIAMMAI